MGLGTKNRLNETAAMCRAHLQDLHPDQSGLVAEFISEIEGSESSLDVTAWNRFTDLRRSPAETKQRVEAAFQQWLAGA